MKIKLSNVYSILSILFKIISVILIVAVVLPGYQTFCDGVSGADETLTTTICLTIKITTVLTPIVTMIYPIIALILLTRQSVKKFQASL